jgi:hypothetical protein
LIECEAEGWAEIVYEVKIKFTSKKPALLKSWLKGTVLKLLMSSSNIQLWCKNK